MPIRRGILLASAMICVACDLVHDQTISYDSPDGQSRVVVATVGIKPQIRIRLRSNSREKLMYPDDPWPRAEFMIHFATVCWTSDSAVAIVYVVNAVGGRPVLLALDVKRQQQIDPGPLRALLSEAIVRDFSLQAQKDRDPKFDPIGWANSREAKEAFYLHDTG